MRPAIQSVTRAVSSSGADRTSALKISARRSLGSPLPPQRPRSARSRSPRHPDALAEQNPDLRSAFSFLILIARFVILEACSFFCTACPGPGPWGKDKDKHEIEDPYAPANPNPT